VQLRRGDEAELLGLAAGGADAVEDGGAQRLAAWAEAGIDVIKNINF
jgi:hypothetical protein